MLYGKVQETLHSLGKVCFTCKGKVGEAYPSKAHGIMLYFPDEKQNFGTITVLKSCIHPCNKTIHRQKHVITCASYLPHSLMNNYISSHLNTVIRIHLRKAN